MLLVNKSNKMFIPEVSIELVEKRNELKEFLITKNDNVKELTDQIKKLDDESQEKQLEYGAVNQKINDILIPIALEKLERHEIPKEISIKDGKVFLEVIDVREDAFIKADALKESWRNLVESRKKEQEISDSIIETLEKSK